MCYSVLPTVECLECPPKAIIGLGKLSRQSWNSAEPEPRAESPLLPISEALTYHITFSWRGPPEAQEGHTGHREAALTPARGLLAPPLGPESKGNCPRGSLPDGSEPPFNAKEGFQNVLEENSSRCPPPCL